MSQKMAFQLMSRALKWECGHEPGEAMEHCCEDDHSHGKQIMADRHSNVKPTATVFDEKKEVQCSEVWQDND